jgi:hypothetical protein
MRAESLMIDPWEKPRPLHQVYRLSGNMYRYFISNELGEKFPT